MDHWYLDQRTLTVGQGWTWPRIVFVCSEAAESKLVNLETSHIVILPPTASVPCLERPVILPPPHDFKCIRQHCVIFSAVPTAQKIPLWHLLQNSLFRIYKQNVFVTVEICLQGGWVLVKVLLRVFQLCIRYSNASTIPSNVALRINYSYSKA